MSKNKSFGSAEGDASCFLKSLFGQIILLLWNPAQFFVISISGWGESDIAFSAHS